MLYGRMMQDQLTITGVLQHAQRFHAGSEIVSRTSDNKVHHLRYEQFYRRVCQLANALVKAGVRSGDRIATLAWNDHRHLEIYYASSCIGAVCHTINPRLFDEQLTFIANDAEDRFLFFDPQFHDKVMELKHTFETVERYIVLCEDEPEAAAGNGPETYESFIADEAASFDWPELDENQASALCYTSGTTGNPKGVLFSHRSTLIHALSVSGGDWLCVRQRDSILPVVPMFHANAWGIPYAALMNGAKLVLPGYALDGPSLHGLLNDERVTLMAGVPTVWLGLLDYLNRNELSINSVERMMVGGSAAPMAIIHQFEERYDVRVMHGWGMTELSPVGTLGALKNHQASLPPQERYQLQALQGRPLFGVDLRIVDEAGHVLPHDGRAIGALQVKGPWVVGSYYKDTSPESFTEDGWFETGDVAAIDPEGYLIITDRTKDVIKSGGEWISSIELENIAVGHPSVAEAACISIKHSKWGERPVVCVVLKEDAEANPDDIKAIYEGQVARWCIPDEIIVVDDLPHTATGKLSKLELRRRFEGYSLKTDQA
ncbi:long-chain fatty acid--CoA ligase [Alcanivorax sp. 24]|uniref:long-chain fatty acid--CoA ligase n=1 Tax=Alcanivorax sp. 24 TaxID=2545266 RepID=UPI00105F5C77|nr:long-chain fatty acid--CoA ligase [Alcanivorax sp. 24]